ncbi:hypothetical protein Acid345_0792 [Candidatus Koribacter versatilis Ellin345]|uniref:SAF domain-containing protein n=1 Tax=Koribacter versatilis (strain Ellin345) TaxID=204669 RepID=Q1ITK3_KORVE|nr:hypothetical protein [Candidatus Koribacter versatilis]ABF39797.1 hypothetical protein Acid345_0792 [Candidatus Koribacter versatilis Ellin345]
MHARYAVILAAAMSLASAPTVLPAQAPPAAPANVLADGTPVHLVLARMVSSETDQPGELVEFVVKKDVQLNGKVLLPENAYVYGKVVAAQLDNREAGKAGSVEFRLESLKLTSGQEIPLRTIRQIPSGAGSDIKPESLTNLVNSPYAPFAHFNNGMTCTVPKDSMLTLYVSGDVAIGQAAVAKQVTQEPAEDSVASRIVDTAKPGKSLGDIAREQRDRGKIGGGMVSSPQ